MPDTMAVLGNVGTTLAVAYPAEVARHLGTPERIRAYCEKVWQLVEQTDDPRYMGAMELYARLLKLLGMDKDTERALLALFGLRDIEEAKRLLAIAQAAEGGRTGRVEDDEAELVRELNLSRTRRGLLPVVLPESVPEAQEG